LKLLEVRTMTKNPDKALRCPFPVIPLVGILLLCCVGATTAQKKVVDIRNIGHRDWKMEAFSLDKKLDLNIEARGAGDHWHEYMYAYAWILDAGTRDVVWEMNLDNTYQRSRRRELEYEGSLTLPEGDYEVYFAVSPFNYKDIHIE
jgi:hypothetical protein